MSYRLVYPFDETKIKPELAEEIFKEFKLDFGLITFIPISVQFLKQDGTWTTIDMFFDTGAVISLISGYVGEEIGLGKYVPHKLSGISRKEDCIVHVKISRVKTRLIDSYGKISPEFDLWIAFAEESVPHVLGMKDVIQHFDFKTNSKAKKFYLEWKE